MSFSEWHKLSYDSLDSKATCHCYMHWHLQVPVMDLNVVTLGLSAALWLKKCSTQKKTFGIPKV